MTMSGSEVKLLILAKALYLHGCTHASQKDAVSRMVAVHHFDNAVEMVLKCAVVRKGKQPKMYFEQLLGQLAEFPLKEQMRSLHRLRNNVQHAGDIPSMDSIIKYKGYTEDFFKEVCDEIFGISYDGLFLSELIGNENVKEQMREAEEALERGEFERCIELCDNALRLAAFEEAEIFYRAGMLIGYWGASEELKMVLREDYPERYRDKAFYDLVKELRGAIVQWGQATTGMQFLDEYRMDFLKYRQIVETPEKSSGAELRDNAQFCLNFATSVVLKWQEEGMFNLKDSELG
jgi:HEPN domain-containing protein